MPADDEHLLCIMGGSEEEMENYCSNIKAVQVDFLHPERFPQIFY